MRELLGASIPGEAPSTCHDCAMCAPASGPIGNNFYYSPTTKCCTYLPRMWNFLSGRVLNDDTPEAARGRATLEARIDAGLAVTPLGLEQTPLFAHLYSKARSSFGRVEALRCPHYIDEAGGLCGVWRHRESTCATWFCKHERGGVGERFFEALHWLLVVAETALARWAVLQLDVGREAEAMLLPLPLKLDAPMGPGDFDGVADREHQRRLWGTWAGREREFYRAAARLVGALAWSDVRAIAGPELQLHERAVGRQYQALGSATLPNRLQVQEIRLEEQGAEFARIGTYSHLDPLSVPVELLGVLRYFDGRETDVALADIESEERLRIDPALVRRLTDFGILKEVDQASA
jgi:hypothetical protein